MSGECGIGRRTKDEISRSETHVPNSPYFSGCPGLSGLCSSLFWALLHCGGVHRLTKEMCESICIFLNTRSTASADTSDGENISSNRTIVRTIVPVVPRDLCVKATFNADDRRVGVG